MSRTAEQMEMDRDTDIPEEEEEEEEEKDRISNLPDEIIHRILSFIDMKYVIQTISLSKKWKYVWTTMPHLKLDTQMFRTMPHLIKFMKHVLSHRNHLTEVYAVELKFRGEFNQIVAKSILNYAYSHNLKQLTIICSALSMKTFELPQSLFSSHTLKHLNLTVASGYRMYVPTWGLPAWDFPALETLNLSNLPFGDRGVKSLDLFSKCVNLKDLKLDNCDMLGMDTFNVSVPQLCNLTITNTFRFPKVFNVVAPQLESLTAFVCDCNSSFLQLSTARFDSLEKVNLSTRFYHREKERYAPRLQDLFQKLSGAKFLILDEGIIEVLSACLNQLSNEPCPFNNLKWLKRKDGTQRMPTKVRNYLLESSPSATFGMDLPQLPWKRSRQEIDTSTMAKKVSKVPHKRSRQDADDSTMANTSEKEKQQTETLDEEKRMLEEKIFRQDEVIAEQKVMLEAMKLQHEKRMLEAKIEMQGKIIAQQKKAMLETTKLEEKLQMQDKVIAEQKVMLETMKLKNDKKMLEVKILKQDKIIAQQKATLEGMKVQHEKIEKELGNIDS